METFFASKSAYPVVAFAIFVICTMAVFVAYFWYKSRRDEMVITLKRELASHGMSAEEIRTVVEAVPYGSSDIAQDLAALNGKPSPAVKSR